MIATNGDLTTPAPLARGLPALYREPDPRAGDAGSFVRRFTDGLDGVLAPVFATLDNLPAYFDPKTAPAGWIEFLKSLDSPATRVVLAPVTSEGELRDSLAVLLGGQNGGLLVIPEADFAHF